MTKPMKTDNHTWADRHHRREIEPYLTAEGTELKKRTRDFLLALARRNNLQPASTTRLLRDAEERLIAQSRGSWDKFVAVFINKVAELHDEQDCLPAGTFTDTADGPHVTYDPPLEAEPDYARIEREALVKRLDNFFRVNDEFNRRMLHSRLPIYSMIKEDPKRHAGLYFLFAVLGAERFEQFIESYAGEAIQVPSLEALQKFDRDREVVHLAGRGIEHEEIARRVSKKPISASQVSRILTQQRLLRQRPMEAEAEFVRQGNRAQNVLRLADVKKALRS
jgi:hypothetical protein